VSAAAKLELIRNRIRDVPDFPKPGVLFKDITPLLADPRAFAASIELLEQRLQGHHAEGIVAVESRGFLFGAALAARMGLPLQLVRKPGKLPYKTVGVSYDLEYGSGRVEIHVDAIEDGRRYAIVDDLIATGGTAGAAAELIELHKGRVACCAFIVELAFLDGRKRLGERPIESLITY
jgi:adenine phosphoribosyltransferase